MTTAEIPASSNCRTLSSFLDNGEADATSGFLSCKPRYVVVKSTIFRPPEKIACAWLFDEIGISQIK
jgi:hypothetical protein